MLCCSFSHDLVSAMPSSVREQAFLNCARKSLNWPRYWEHGCSGLVQKAGSVNRHIFEPSTRETYITLSCLDSIIGATGAFAGSSLLEDFVETSGLGSAFDMVGGLNGRTLSFVPLASANAIAVSVYW